MRVASQAFTILQKDLRVEWRRRERLTPMLFFILLVLLVFNFSFEPRGVSLGQVGPGVLWSAFVFASLFGLNRTFAIERTNNSMDALRLVPVSAGALYLAKMVGNLMFLVVVESIGLPIFALFFNLRAGFYLLPLALILALGSLCLSAVGTLFAAISDQSRLRELMLPLLLLPVIVPALISCVEASDLVLAQSHGQGGFEFVPELMRHLQILCAYAVVFTTLSLMLFDYIIGE